MNKLDLYRKEIDKIDNQIIGLLKKRFDIVITHIFPYKKNLDLPAKDEKRYKQIIKNLTQKSDSLISKKFIKELRSLIHTYSLKLQK